MDRIFPIWCSHLKRGPVINHCLQGWWVVRLKKVRLQLLTRFDFLTFIQLISSKSSNKICSQILKDSEKIMTLKIHIRLPTSDSINCSTGPRLSKNWLQPTNPSLLLWKRLDKQTMLLSYQGLKHELKTIFTIKEFLNTKWAVER